MFFCERTQRSAFLVMLRTILNGAPFTAARMAEPPAVVKSMLPVTNAAIQTLVRMTIPSTAHTARQSAVGPHDDTFGVETFAGEKFFFGRQMNRPGGKPR